MMAPHDPMNNKRPDGTMGVNDGTDGAKQAMEDVQQEDKNRTRSKSPLVDSAKRPDKCQKVEIYTPLAAVPTFPSIISDGDKGAKGEKGKGKYGEQGKGEGKGGGAAWGSEKGGDPWSGWGGNDPWGGNSVGGNQKKTI